MKKSKKNNNHRQPRKKKKTKTVPFSFPKLIQICPGTRGLFNAIFKSHRKRGTMDLTEWTNVAPRTACIRHPSMIVSFSLNSYS